MRHNSVLIFIKITRFYCTQKHNEPTERRKKKKIKTNITEQTIDAHYLILVFMKYYSDRLKRTINFH